MHRPESFLHIVNCKEIGNSGKSVEQVVLETETGSWADDSRLREQLSRDSFSLGLDW